MALHNKEIAEMLNEIADLPDLKDRYIKQAEETGLKLAVSTDSHSVGKIEYMKPASAFGRQNNMNFTSDEYG